MGKALQWAFASLPLTASTIAVLVCFTFTPVVSLQDDWYSFVSFQDPSEWKRVYGYTCQYKPDHFREPREYKRRDDLLGPRELKSPIAFRSKDTIKSKENYTLHIYNSPSIRKGYSVSYGFQRNKECLHGQDSECIVYPNLGRIRALVVNAERFKDKQNLNFIKDHFLIEEPERFATILNGGSIFERKFYEAVFLGGYTRDPERTSHQIDGKKYPMEIYMYFLDETVPSVSLSTILVVLVEESDRENIYAKPIINAIENKLYNSERRFLEENRALIRRERLFHHLEGSTTYDIHDRLGRAARGETIYQETLEHSEIHEGKYTRIVETFEKMETLETELFFLYEDLRRVDELIAEHVKSENEFEHRMEFGLHFPYNVTELHIMAFVAFAQGFTGGEGMRFQYADCKEASLNSTKPYSSLAEALYLNTTYWEYYVYRFGYNYTFDALTNDPAHLKWFEETTTEVCELFRKYKELHDINLGGTMRNIQVEQKYELIRRFAENKKIVEKLNDNVYKHFHVLTPEYFHYEAAKYTSGAKLFEFPVYKYPQQKYQIVDGMFDLIFGFVSRLAFGNVREGILEKISEAATELQYKSDRTMRRVIRYIKHGDRADFSKYPRNKVHSNSVNQISPDQEKKRTLVEYGGMEIPEEKIQADSLRDPIKEIIDDPFQISWLIPQNGGYYFYKGSSPLPPCFRAQNVIVFKKPIKMTRRQINILARVPTSFERSEDIRVTTPFVHDTYFEVDLTSEETENVRTEEVIVPVYDEKRNHLFLGRDGVHKNAVEEWNRLLELRKNVAPRIIAKDFLKVMMIMCLMIINIVLV